MLKWKGREGKDEGVIYWKDKSGYKHVISDLSGREVASP